MARIRYAQTPVATLMHRSLKGAPEAGPMIATLDTDTREMTLEWSRLPAPLSCIYPPEPFGMIVRAFDQQPTLWAREVLA